MPEISNLERELHQAAHHRRWTEREMGFMTALSFGVVIALSADYLRGRGTIALAASTTAVTTLVVIKALVNEDMCRNVSEPDRGQIDWTKPEVRESLAYAPHYLPRVNYLSAADGPSFEEEKAGRAADKAGKRLKLGDKGFLAVTGGMLLGWIGIIAAGLGRAVQGSQVWHTRVSTLAGSVGSAAAGIWLCDIWRGLAAQRAELYYQKRQPIVEPQAKKRTDQVRDERFLEALRTGTPKMTVRIASRRHTRALAADYNKKARSQAAWDRLDNDQLKNLGTSLAQYRDENGHSLTKPVVVVRDGTQLTLEGIIAAFPDDPWGEQDPVILYLEKMSEAVKQQVSIRVGNAVITQGV